MPERGRLHRFVRSTKAGGGLGGTTLPLPLGEFLARSALRASPEPTDNAGCSDTPACPAAPSCGDRDRRTFFREMGRRAHERCLTSVQSDGSREDVDSGNDAAANGVQHEFGRAVHVELLQDVGPVRVDGRGAHREQIRDFLVAVALGDELEDFAFTL